MMQKILHALPWRKVLTIAFVAFVVARLGSKYLHWAASPYKLVIESIILLLLLRFALDWVLAAQAAWQARQQGATLRQQLLLAIPPACRAMISMQWLWLVGFANWTLRRAPPIEKLAGTRFGYMNKGQYGTFFAMFIISLLVDIPVSSLIAGVLTNDIATRHTIHLVFFVASVYLLLICLGDRFHLQHTSHLCDENTLALRIGLRFRADIPMHAITNVQEFDGGWETWHKSNRNSTVVRPCMFDAPNVLLTINPAFAVQMVERQQAMPLPHFVVLYVDDPASLMRQIKQFNQLMQQQ